MDIFSKIFKLINILLNLPLGTSTVKWSFCQMDMPSSRISDINLARQMRIAIEGCELTSIKLLTYRLSCIMMNSFMCNISLGVCVGVCVGGVGNPSVPAHICIYP